MLDSSINLRFSIYNKMYAVYFNKPPMRIFISLIILLMFACIYGKIKNPSAGSWAEGFQLGVKRSLENIGFSNMEKSKVSNVFLIKISSMQARAEQS